MQRKIAQIASLTLTICGSMLFAEEDGYWELLTDFVYMERYHVKDQTLVLRTPNCANCSSTVALNTKSLAKGLGFEPGLQGTLSYIQDPRSSYDLGFLYVWDWENTKTKTSPTSSLTVPFEDPTFTSDFFEVSKVEAFYGSRFYTLDLNYEKAFGTSRESFISLSGLGGLRFASLREKFSLTAYNAGNFGELEVKTHNDLIGLQVGFAFQINAIKELHWDFDGKAGVGVNRIDVDSFLGDQNNTVQLRNFSKQDWQTNVFAEASAGVGYRALSCMDIHAGYQMLYFCGLALAMDQVDTSSRTSSLTVDRDGYVIVHGIYVGFLFSF